MKAFLNPARLLRTARDRARLMGEVERILSLTPEERLREVANVSRFIAAARRVRVVDPARKREKNWRRRYHSPR